MIGLKRMPNIYLGCKVPIGFFGMETFKEPKNAFATSENSRSNYFEQLKKIEKKNLSKEEKELDAREKLLENSSKKQSQLLSEIHMPGMKPTSNWERHLRAQFIEQWKEAGLRKLAEKIYFWLQKNMSKKRLNFVKDTFQGVWITDECVFQLHRNKVQVRSSKKCPRPTKVLPKNHRKIMVWGALSYHGFYLKS